MKAKDLTVGSIIEIEVYKNDKSEKVQTSISRCTGHYVWFKYSGYERISRNTIDKFPTLYKIISI